MTLNQRKTKNTRRIPDELIVLRKPKTEEVMKIDMSDRLLEQNIIRAYGAESVELPIDSWVNILEELKILRKLAFDLHDLFNCKDGHLSATGERNKRLCNLLTDTANIVHAVKYAEVD